MASQIKVTTSELSSNADNLQNSNNRLNTMIDQLRQQEASLCTMWEGDSKDAFDKAFRHDIDQMKNFYEAIKQHVAKLKEIAKNYETAEQRNVQIANERKYR